MGNPGHNHLKLQVKSRWVAALRSGMFQQASNTLRNSEGHCCLGVLCELHAEETGTQFVVPDDGSTAEQSYLGSSEYLPPAVADWAGLTDIDPSVSWSNEEGIHYSSLSDCNDRDVPFEKIADIIEEQL